MSPEIFTHIHLYSIPDPFTIAAWLWWMIIWPYSSVFLSIPLRPQKKGPP
jgi:hypothetical protein